MQKKKGKKICFYILEPSFQDIFHAMLFVQCQSQNKLYRAVEKESCNTVLLLYKLITSEREHDQLGSMILFMFLLFLIISVVKSQPSEVTFTEIVTNKTSFSRRMTINCIIFVLPSSRRIQDYLNRCSDSM